MESLLALLLLLGLLALAAAVGIYIGNDVRVKAGLPPQRTPDVFVSDLCQQCSHRKQACACIKP